MRGVVCVVSIGSGGYDGELVEVKLKVVHGAELIRVYHVFENYGVTVFDVLEHCARGDLCLCVFHTANIVKRGNTAQVLFSLYRVTD